MLTFQNQILSVICYGYMTIQIFMKIFKELYLKYNLKLKKINTSQPDESIKDYKIEKM